VSEKSIEEKQYMRQIYKQQLANIGMDNSHEKRLFSGVQGMEDGELFGLANLFASIDSEDVEVNIENRTTMKVVIDRARDTYEEIQMMEINADPTAQAAIQSELSSLFEPQGDYMSDVLRSAGASYSFDHNKFVGHSCAEEAIAKRAQVEAPTESD
jgi:hypothetical protein